MPDDSITAEQYTLLRELVVLSGDDITTPVSIYCAALKAGFEKNHAYHTVLALLELGMAHSITENRILDTNRNAEGYNAGIKVIRLAEGELMTEIAVVRNIISNKLLDGSYNDINVDETTVGRIVKRGNITGSKARGRLTKLQKNNCSIAPDVDMI